MNNLFTIKNVLIYLVIINLITFLSMYIDKKRAKCGKWRIKESTLFTLVLLGGGIGGIAGMKVFRHKTKKMRFVIGFPLILILEVVCTVIFICIN